MLNLYMEIRDCNFHFTEQLSCSSIGNKTFRLSTTEDSRARRYVRSRKTRLPSLFFGTQERHKWHRTVAEFTNTAHGLRIHLGFEVDPMLERFLVVQRDPQIVSVINQVILRFPGHFHPNVKTLLTPKSGRGMSLLVVFLRRKIIQGQKRGEWGGGKKRRSKIPNPGQSVHVSHRGEVFQHGSPSARFQVAATTSAALR